MGGKVVWERAGGRPGPETAGGRGGTRESEGEESRGRGAGRSGGTGEDLSGSIGSGERGCGGVSTKLK